MKVLEQQCKLALFDRGKRTPKLTPLGLALVAKARELVEAYDALVPSILGEKGVSGIIRLGAVPTTLVGIVPMAIARLTRIYPQLAIIVVSGLSLDLMRQVERGSLDMAIISRPQFISRNISWAPIVDEPLELLSSNILDSDDPIYLLRTQPFIRFSRHAVVGGVIEEWLQKNRIDVRESMELESLESISSMVAANLGVSIVPRPSIPQPNPLPLKHIPLDNGRLLRSLGLISRSGNVRAFAVREVHQRLVEAVEMGVFEPATSAPLPTHP